MAWVVNKTTFQLLENVNTPDYPPQEWLINPNLDAVRNISNNFWNIVNIDGAESLVPKSFIDIDTDNSTVSQTQQQKLNELSDACANTIMSGFTSTALNGAPRLYDSQDVDQLNLIGSITVTSPMPGGPVDGSSIPYASRDINTLVKSYDVHTYLQLRQVIGDGANFKLQQLVKFFSLKYQVLALTKVSEIQQINW